MLYIRPSQKINLDFYKNRFSLPDIALVVTLSLFKWQPGRISQNPEQLASFEFHKSSKRGFAKCHAEVYGNLWVFLVSVHRFNDRFPFRRQESRKRIHFHHLENMFLSNVESWSAWMVHPFHRFSARSSGDVDLLKMKIQTVLGDINRSISSRFQQNAVWFPQIENLRKFNKKRLFETACAISDKQSKF